MTVSLVSTCELATTPDVGKGCPWASDVMAVCNAGERIDGIASAQLFAVLAVVVVVVAEEK